MTTQEILDAVKRKILESDNPIVDEDVLLLYINLAHKDVIKKAFPNSSIQTATVTFTGGVATPPSDFGTLYDNAYDANGNYFTEQSISGFNRLGNDYGIVYKGGSLYISPTDTTSVTINYYPTYPTLTLVVNPTINDYLHEPIVYGATWRAFEDLQDQELATYYQEKYEKFLTDSINTLSQYEENAQYGGTMFNGLRII